MNPIQLRDDKNLAIPYFLCGKCNRIHYPYVKEDPMQARIDATACCICSECKESSNGIGLCRKCQAKRFREMIVKASKIAVKLDDKALLDLGCYDWASFMSRLTPAQRALGEQP